MALIFGACSSSQSGLSEHAWVHMPISRQNSGMSGGVLKHGDLALTRDCVEHILSPRAPMALIIGASCNSQSGLSEHKWVHMPISRQNSGMPRGVLKHGDLDFPAQNTNVFIHIYTCVRIVSIEISNLTHSVRTMCLD